MIKKSNKQSSSYSESCCGTTTIGERGQIVIPAEARRTLKLKAGDKLMVFVHHNQVLGLVKTDTMERFLKNLTKQFNHFSR